MIMTHVDLIEKLLKYAITQNPHHHDTRTWLTRSLTGTLPTVATTRRQPSQTPWRGSKADYEAMHVFGVLWDTLLFKSGALGGDRDRPECVQGYNSHRKKILSSFQRPSHESVAQLCSMQRQCTRQTKNLHELFCCSSQPS
jgi:hypothetical protein